MISTPFAVLAGSPLAPAGYRALILAGWVKPILFIFLSPVIGMFVLMGIAIGILTLRLALVLSHGVLH